MLHINVASLRFGDGKTEPYLPDISLYVASDTISLSDLIARTVEEQVAKLLDEQQQTVAQTQALLDRQYIDKDELAEQAKSGKIAIPGTGTGNRAKKPGQKIEIAQEIKRAVQAFESGSYKIFINGREFIELGETVALTEGMKVNFVRLMPLVGG